MSFESSFQHLPEAFVSAIHQAEQRPATGESDRAVRGFTVAISSEVGARGSEVARCLGLRFGWPVYDRELLDLIAQRMHVRVQLVEDADERHLGWLEAQFAAFAALPHVSDASYVRHLVDTLQALGARGECVIVGRGSCFCLPGLSTLRVRLVAPIADRIAVVSRDRRLSRFDAARYIETCERDQARFVREHFQRDLGDARNFDLILNEARWSIEESVEMIVAALRQRRVHVVEKHLAATAAG